MITLDCSDMQKQGVQAQTDRRPPRQDQGGRVLETLSLSSGPRWENIRNIYLRYHYHHHLRYHHHHHDTPHHDHDHDHDQHDDDDDDDDDDTPPGEG